MFLTRESPDGIGGAASCSRSSTGEFVLDLIQLVRRLVGAEEQVPRRSLFVRRVRISGDARGWFFSRTHIEQCMFAEFLLKLDANPVAEGTHAILGAGARPGMRWTVFGDFRAIYTWNPVEDRITVILCTPVKK